MPAVQPEDHAVLAQQRDYLTGEHDKIIQKFRTGNDYLENTNLQEIVRRGNQKTSLREIHRVAYLVQTITSEALLVPHNSYSLNYADKLAPTEGFQCPWKELGEVGRFCRFVRPSEDKVLRYIALASKGQKVSYLEEATGAEDQFSVLKDAMGVNFWVKSMVWPGFVNYFRANSATFGHVYFGNGLKNKNLHFTLQ